MTKTEGDSIEKIQAALNHERTNHKAARGLLDQARDKVRALESELTAATVAKDPSTDKIQEYLAAAVKAQLAQATSQQLSRIAALEKELAEAKTATESVKTAMAAKTVEAEIRDACAKHHVLPTAANDIVLLGKLSLKLGDDGTVATEDGLSAFDFIDRMKETSPHYWPTSVGSGHAWQHDPRPPGGLGSAEILAGESGNPFDQTSASFNLTKAGELLKSDPQRAAKLKAAAGLK